MNEIEEIILAEGEYCWSTGYDHADNMETMNEFLDLDLPEGYSIVLEDGTYAEIQKGDARYGVHASGNGDFFNHKVRFELL